MPLYHHYFQNPYHQAMAKQWLLFMSHMRKSLPNPITHSPEVFVLFTKPQKQHSTSVEALSSKEKLKHVGQALEAIHRESIQSGLD